MSKTVVSSDNAPAAIGPYSQGIQAGSLIITSGQLPIDPAIAAACDAGRIEDVQGDWLSSLADAIEGK